MRRWPKSRVWHGFIAFVGATILAAVTFRPILDMRMDTYAREYPHDGQSSLGAFFDACSAAFLIEIAAGVLLFKLQRRIVSRSSG